MEDILSELPTFSPRPSSANAFQDYQSTPGLSSSNFRDEDLHSYYSNNDKMESSQTGYTLGQQPSLSYATHASPTSNTASSAGQLAFAQFAASLNNSSAPQSTFSANMTTNDVVASLLDGFENVPTSQQGFSLPTNAYQHQQQQQFAANNSSHHHQTSMNGAPPAYNQLLQSLQSQGLESGSLQTDASSTWSELDVGSRY